MESLSRKTRAELIAICKERHLRGYSTKKRDELLALLSSPETTTTDHTTKTIRYLGCKQKLLQELHTQIQQCADEFRRDHPEATTRPLVLFDAFAGTGSVSSYFASQGYDILACDILRASSLLTNCMVGIRKEQLQFSRILPEGTRDPIEAVLALLNALPEQTDYITQTYTPLGNRMYFTEGNGRKIDAIRMQIDTWKRETLISQEEHDFLLGSLLLAVSLVSNTAGTYGAFNKKWDKRAEKPLTLTHTFRLGEKVHRVFCGDVKTYLANPELSYDILYLDPPYNQRQYGSYYHLLETIVRNDKPVVNGITGVRDCSDVRSDFCNPKKVALALEELVRLSTSSYVVMSYNNEGLLTKEVILTMMGKYGQVRCEEIPYERYNRVKDKGSSVVEYVFVLKKGPATTTLRTETVPTIEPVDALATLVEQLRISEPLPWYNKIHNMDCIEGMKQIPDASIDLILTDLPYGLTECKWDSVIPLDALWAAYKRIIKPNGAIVLFAQQPFTSMLVASNLEMFKYSLVWKKSKTGNFAQAPYRFLCEHEDIVVFSYGKVSKNGKPRMKYFPQGTRACHIEMKGKNGNTEHREGRAVQKDYVQTVTNYPRSILEFGNEGKPEHPTQKPVGICEYLIRTYTEEGDVVLDSCMGACTTAVAALRTRRYYVGYEKEKKYYDIGLARIEKMKTAFARENNASQPQEQLPSQ